LSVYGSSRWSSGTDIVTYKQGGNEEDDNWMMTSPSRAVGDVDSWAAKTVEQERSYAMHVTIEPSKSYVSCVIFTLPKRFKLLMID